MERSEIRVIISDAGPIIHLDELDCLDLLSDFDSILIPGAVWNEIVYHRPQALNNASINIKKIIINENNIFSNELKSLITMYSLHKGEQEALLLAEENTSSIFLTDDAAARLAANHLNIQVHGTIGILIRSIRRGQKTCNDVIEMLNSIPVKSTLHIRNSILIDIVDSLKKS